MHHSDPAVDVTTTVRQHPVEGLLRYAAIAAVYWWFQRRAEAPPPERPGDQRIEIRDGGTAVFLPPADILFVEAAGNYIEFHTAARTHLVVEGDRTLPITMLISRVPTVIGIEFRTRNLTVVVRVEPLPEVLELIVRLGAAARVARATPRVARGSCGSVPSE